MHGGVCARHAMPLGKLSLAVTVQTTSFTLSLRKKKKKKSGVVLLQRKRKQKPAGKIFCAQLLARGCARPLEIPLLMTLLNANLHIF